MPRPVLLLLWKSNTGIYTYRDAGERPYIEADAGPSPGLRACAALGELRQGRSVLVEHHPEEYHHCEYKQQGDDPLLCLRRSKLRAGGCRRCRAPLLLVDKDMGIGAASEEIYQEAHYERDAGHSEGIAVAGGEGGDVIGGEGREVGGAHAVVRHCRDKLRAVLLPVKIAVAEGWQRRGVGEAFRAQGEVTHGCSRHGGEHGADVDGHIEKGESRVALSAVAGLVVEVAHHHLEVALEETGAA